MKRYFILVVLIIFIPFLVVNLFICINDISYRSYKGKRYFIRVKSKDGIKRVEIEDYVVGVLSGEMPTTFNLEALKAQAVASRSYALYQKSHSKGDFDVYDDTSSQVYLSDDVLRKRWGSLYDEKIGIIRNAVRSTSLEYLSYDGKVAETFFFSTSPGATENSEDVFSSFLPYLRSTVSAWDRNSPKFESNVSLSLSDFYGKLGLEFSDNLDVRYDLSGTGRVKGVFFNGHFFKGRDVSRILGLRSNYFRVNLNGNMVSICVLGFGHGVGMSQYGANGMANDGYGYRDILAYYYRGTKLVKLSV